MISDRPRNSTSKAIMLSHDRQQLGFPSEGAPAESEEQIVAFSHYVWLLRRHWWKCAIVIALCTGLTALTCARLTPLYEGVARIAIDTKMSSTVVGEASMASSGGVDTDQLFNTEIQLIQSDAVLRPVDEKFHLRNLKPSAKDPKGIHPSEAPVSLSTLGVVHPPNSYLINITYRSPDPRLAAAVANAVAHSYIQHNREMRSRSSIDESLFMEVQISELKKKMEDSERALAGYEKQLGLINPDEKTSMLSARILQLNTQYLDAANERIRKEADYRALQSGSAAALQVSSQAATLTKLEDAVHAAESRMAMVRGIYGTTHPEYKHAASELAEASRQYESMLAEVGKRVQVEYEVARSREAKLHDSLAQAKGESDALNSTSFQYQQLKQEAEANKSLYNELFRKVKEASINGGFQGSAIRVADEARPQIQPVFPQKKLLLALAILISTGLSLITIILVDMFDKTLRDPNQVRRSVGIEAIGVLPYVKDFGARALLDSSQASNETAIARSQGDWFSSEDFYNESISTLLSSILLDHRASPLRSMLVTSAASGEGKSTCVAHIAAAHARQGHRTLLIDADLRRPSQQICFNLRNHIGLSDVISDGKSLSQVRQRVEGGGILDVVTAGYSEPHMFNQVANKVQALIRQAYKEYDVVFIDAPPMLCFAEPIQIACMVDGVLVVSRAGETSRQAVAGVINTLRRLKVNTIGLVLNQVRHDMSDAYRPYQAYYRHASRRQLKVS